MIGVRALDHVQIAMPVGGEAEARGFYAGLLGLREVPKPAELTGRGGLWFDTGTVELHLGVEHDFRPAKKAHVALCVEDIEAARADCVAAGLPLKEDVAIGGATRFFTEDPFGNRVEFIAVRGFCAAGIEEDGSC